MAKRRQRGSTTAVVRSATGRRSSGRKTFTVNGKTLTKSAGSRSIVVKRSPGKYTVIDGSKSRVGLDPVAVGMRHAPEVVDERRRLFADASAVQTEVSGDPLVGTALPIERALRSVRSHNA